MDLNARRKNATRESTNTLKAWLHEHRNNPYPTKGEKIMLAIITKMTLTQVSTWFANARRRLKKENKMTWEPKNRVDVVDEDVGDDPESEEDDKKDEKQEKEDILADGNFIRGDKESAGKRTERKEVTDEDERGEEKRVPKIWSLADTARKSNGSNNNNVSKHNNNHHHHHTSASESMVSGSGSFTWLPPPMPPPSHHATPATFWGSPIHATYSGVPSLSNRAYHHLICPPE
ncbi:unnamed protein product [Darwinula stevensoni]|uniref:Homeobox domain-containing protein n=1 Tax=Darwinula stevensoni TaxID=69355 RepID=A0A7R9AE81_9CRUS|nr:unnamed protein product [Darwinula stevensoni]CAG0902074.1 unnamed protein product [Darwinula stevensoni]